MKTLHHPSRIYHSSRVLTLGEFFTSDEQGIEGICAIGTVFEEIFFRLSQLLTSLVLVEVIEPTSSPSSLNSENQVIVILARRCIGACGWSISTTITSTMTSM
jgi:hypothetical protein